MTARDEHPAAGHAAGGHSSGGPEAADHGAGHGAGSAAGLRGHRGAARGGVGPRAYDPAAEIARRRARRAVGSTTTGYRDDGPSPDTAGYTNGHHPDGLPLDGHSDPQSAPGGQTNGHRAGGSVDGLAGGTVPERRTELPEQPAGDLTEAMALDAARTPAEFASAARGMSPRDGGAEWHDPRTGARHGAPDTAEPATAETPTGAVPATTATGGAAPTDDPARMVELIRESFDLVAERSDEMTQLFYGWLFRIAPETRDLFPVTMQLQRTRLLRALVHVVQMVDRTDELSVFLRQLGRDHRKFGVVAEHYDKVGEALVGAIRETAGRRWTDAYEAAWTDAYDIVARLMLDAAEAERGPAVWMARVVEHRRLTADLAVIRVQTSQPVPYEAGQYVSVEIPQRARMWRPMTPANAPGSDCVLEFHVTAVEGGWVSRAMVAHSQVGDVWRIGPPMGQMTLDPRSGADLLMVAGGTGLAPARAIIEQLSLDGTDRKVALFVGGQRFADLYDIDALRRMAHEYPWLTVVPVVEDDGGPYGAETGTLGEVVARHGAWADRQILVAGSPDMVRTTVSALLEAGTPFTQIHYDPYHTD